MPIRKRLENTVPVALEQEARPVKDQFDPSKNAFEGSTYETVLGLTEENALPVLKHEAYTTRPMLPSQMPVQELLAGLRLNDNKGDSTETRYRQRIRSPLTAIRSQCISCKGGSPKQANQCAKMDCPLWPFRMGQNAFYGRRSS